MDKLSHLLSHDMFNPNKFAGALFYGALALLVASVLAYLVRRFARRLEKRLSDVTVLRFVSLFVQMLVYLIALVLYAHMIPELRTIGTALLAGASVLSVVAGLAAQDTLGNLIAGFSLVLSGDVKQGDVVKLYAPVGVITAKVHLISLGTTTLLDDDGNQVVVPNSMIMSSAIIKITQPPSHAADKA